MRRGDLVTVAMQGDHGKPRPALVIQADPFADTVTVTVLLLSSTVVDAPLLRLTVDPAPGNGLQRRSQVQVDKTMTVRREKVGSVIGRMEDRQMLEVSRLLAVFLGIA